MGYNLWLSEDSIYTLGRRLRRCDTRKRVRESEVCPARPELHLDSDMTKINALMDELALCLERRRLEAC
jgi:hypothetical protein